MSTSKNDGISEIGTVSLKVPEVMQSEILENAATVFARATREDGEIPNENGIHIRDARVNFMNRSIQDTLMLSEDSYRRAYTDLRGDFGYFSPAFSVHISEIPASLRSILAERGMDVQGEYVPVMNTDALPEKFWKYVLLHEYWEMFIYGRNINNELWDALSDEEIAQRESEGGKLYNMRKRSDVDHEKPFLERENPDHCFALQREFGAAEQDGTLDEYFSWWENWYTELLDSVASMPPHEHDNLPDYLGQPEEKRENLLRKLQRHLDIRRKIYRKIVGRRKIRAQF
jgi:hypothetical protein